MLWVLWLWKRVYHIVCHFADLCVVLLAFFSFLGCLLSLSFFLDLLCLLEQVRRRSEHSSWSHHPHGVHPWLLMLHILDSLCINLRVSHCCSGFLLASTHWVPDWIEVDWLLLDVLEGVLHVLLGLLVVELHLLELVCHHLLSLHVLKLLLHHSHSIGVLCHCRVCIAFSSLPSSCITHYHALHHIGQWVGTESIGLLSVGLTRPTRHRFVKHISITITSFISAGRYYFLFWSNGNLIWATSQQGFVIYLTHFQSNTTILTL